MMRGGFQEDCRHTFAALLHLVYPTPCAVCEEPNAEIRSGLCPGCTFRLIGVSPLVLSSCACCGETVGEMGLVGSRCRLCRQIPPPFDSLRSIAPYEGIYQQVILAYKFGGRRELAKILGELLVSAPRPVWDWEELSGILPVPMHKRRFAERGFDHALLLARALQRALRKEGGLKIPIYENLLYLTRAAPHQTGAPRQLRKENLRGSLAFNRNAARFYRSQLKNLLLVDDVVTTRSTLEACSLVLRAALPNSRLHALTVARTERPFDISNSLVSSGN